MAKFKINTALQRRYSKIAKFWNNKEYAGLRRDDVMPEIIKNAKLDELGSEPMIFEAMCGTGIVGKAVKEALEKQNKKCNLFYLDFSKEMLKQIATAAKKFLGDARQMPFSDQIFDRVFMRHAIHDIDKNSQEDVFSEVFRVLKNDGMFILIVFYTTDATQRYYNRLVNLKDELAGRKNDFERHFPTKKEYVGLFQKAGFTGISNNFDFVGRIAYQNTTELNNETGAKWKNFVLSMPPRIKTAMDLKLRKGILEYSFPCTIFTTRKKKA